MASIFSAHFTQEQFDDDDIRDLELAFQFDDETDEYNKKKTSPVSITEKKETYYIDLIIKLKKDFPDTWTVIENETIASGEQGLLQNNKYILSLFIDILYPSSPKKNKLLDNIKKTFNPPPTSKAYKNLDLRFRETLTDTKKPASDQVKATSPITFIGSTKQHGGATFFFVDDIVKLNNNGIDWCENDQQKCTNDVDKYNNFSDMLFRFIEYTNNNMCSVKLIHPHYLYEQWGGEDSDDLKFPEKYLKKKIH